MIRAVPRGQATRYRISDLGRDHRLSDHFTLGELACKCSADEVLVHAGLIDVLERIRARFGTTIITSGYRTRHHNSVTLPARGYRTAADSFHIEGYAADFWCPSADRTEVFAWLAEHVRPGGLGLYNGHLHVDIGADGAAWNHSSDPTPEPGDFQFDEPVVGPPIPLTPAQRLSLWLPNGVGRPAWLGSPDAGQAATRSLRPEDGQIVALGIAAVAIGMTARGPGAFGL